VRRGKPEKERGYGRHLVLGPHIEEFIDSVYLFMNGVPLSKCQPNRKANSIGRGKRRGRNIFIP